MEAEDDVCVVCSDDMTILAIGVCDHPICYKCSTRLRVLCEENYCPTCRTDLPQVVLVRKLQKFDDIKNKHEMPANDRYKMIFEDVVIENEFKKLISHHCPVCPAAEPEGFPKFTQLRAHMRMDHNLFYCELCSKNLKIFTSERKVYNQFELGRHRNEGDPDDTSYRGHPMCKFCRQRYMDTDELYRHLRKDHLFCHFCDADGHADQYYDDYEVLKEHFKRKHFLCEEPDCAQEQFTHAFRTDIDLKKHIAQEHGQSLTKAQARQARTIEVDIQLAPRVRPRDVSGGQMHYRNDNRGRMSKNQRGRLYFEERDNELKRAIQASLEDENQRERQKMEPEGAQGGREEKENKKKKEKEKETPPTPKLNLTEDFPTLTPRASEANTFQTQWTSRSNTSILVTNRNEEFPTLSALSIQPPPVPKVSSSSTKKQGTKKSEVNSQKQNQPPICFEKDFPELAAPKRRPNSANVSITVSNAWSKQSNQQPQQQQQKQPLKVQSQKKQQQQPKPPNQQQPLITNGKALSKMSLSYTPPPESPAMPPPTVTLIESKPIETPVRSLKDVSKLLDTEENFPSLKKSKNKQQASTKVSNWPVKKVTQKAPEESKKSAPEGCVVLKGKKHKEKANSATGDNNKQNKKDASCLDSNKLSSSAELSANEPVLNSRLQQNEKPNKKKEFSEVKIDLKKQPKNSDANKKQKQFSAKIVLSENEFPSLGKQEQPAVPTGNKANQVKPPPGFSGPFTNHNVKNHRPPPGLTLPNNNMKNLLTQNLPSSSVTEQATKFHYCPPSNFDKRNKNLISDINEALANDGSRFGTFKSLSRDFRQGTISSREYYRQCSDLLGSERFPQIFIELICLLPDIDKQQALLLAHRDSSTLQINNFSKGAWRLFDKNVQSCPICQQALIKADYNAHLSLCHPNDFPLDSTDTWSSGKFQESTWIKAK